MEKGSSLLAAYSMVTKHFTISIFMSQLIRTWIGVSRWCLWNCRILLTFFLWKGWLRTVFGQFFDVHYLIHTKEYCFAVLFSVHSFLDKIYISVSVFILNGIVEWYEWNWIEKRRVEQDRPTVTTRSENNYAIKFSFI